MQSSSAVLKHVSCHSNLSSVKGRETASVAALVGKLLLNSVWRKQAAASRWTSMRDVSVAISTHTTGIQQFLHFCHKYHAQPLPASRETLVYLATDLSRSLAHGFIRTAVRASTVSMVPQTQLDTTTYSS